MIEWLAGLLQRNLVVCLAFVVIPMKWLIVRVCRDKEAEAVAILSAPEDLCYVVLGLVMGDVINGSGAFHREFGKSPYISMEIFLTVSLGLAIALGIHVLAQFADKHWKGWRAAERSLATDMKPKPGEVAIPNAEDNFRTLQYRHMFLFLLGYGLQLVLIFPWIHWIANVIGRNGRVSFTS
jgi:hypothetical protein